MVNKLPLNEKEFDNLINRIDYLMDLDVDGKLDKNGLDELQRLGELGAEYEDKHSRLISAIDSK